MGATYWIGQNGNIYYGSGQQGAPVMDLGKANTGQFEARGDGLYDRFTDNGVPRLVYAASQIGDPAVGSSSPAPSGGGGPASPPLNRAGIDNTQRTLNELPALLQAALAAERQRYGNVVNEFNAQEQGQRKTYDESTVTNQKNYDSTFMDSIRAGIKGLGGLMSLLRGTGAGGGTAEEQARDTVGGVTSNDIRAGADTRNENQSTLDTSLSSFLSELGLKRRVNEDAIVNNERAIQRDNLTQTQDLFGKMAGFYGDAGDTNGANTWMARAGDLTPAIAANSRAQVSAYDTTPVAIKAPELTAFAGPTQPSVTTAPGGQVGSGIFTMTDPRRRKEAAPAPLPVGA